MSDTGRQRLVIIESPFSGDVSRNECYARKAMLDSLARGEAPFASHLLYTQVLDDADDSQRALGISVGFAWAKKADATAVYTDFGISSGMAAGIAHAIREGRTVEYREILQHEKGAE